MAHGQGIIETEYGSATLPWGALADPARAPIDRLQPMICAINTYMHSSGPAARHEAMVAAAHFCRSYPDSFCRAFLGELVSARVIAGTPRGTAINLDAFVAALAQRPGECIFLLRDAFSMMEAYQAEAGRGFGVKVNRATLCRDEQSYFDLLGIMYRAALTARTYAAFRRSYMQEFGALIDRSPALYTAARAIARYVSDRSSAGRITFVDTGAQFTFALFCEASLRRFGKGQTIEVFTYTTYPWLRSTFAGRFFSSDSAAVIPIEEAGVSRYETAREQRAVGALLGFAIGDALGFPAAGVELQDVPRIVPGGRIVGFSDAPCHPYFHGLKPGQYTSNTIMLRAMAQHLARERGYDEPLFLAELTALAKNSARDPGGIRWLGATTSAVFARLLSGERPAAVVSGSCAASYRAVPLGLFLQSKTLLEPGTVATLARRVARLTHDSDLAAAGATFVAVLIADLIAGVPPRSAVRGALRMLRRNDRAQSLITKLERAVFMSTTATIQEARDAIGTGSPTDQTLPLALFCFLRRPDDFRQVVLDAANSFRVDSPRERQRLAKLGFRKAMQAAKGGNTDGIAGLAGAFAGAWLGEEAIPPGLTCVEEASELRAEALTIVRG